MPKHLSQKKSQEIDHKLLSLGFTIEQLVEMAGYAIFEVLQSIIQSKHQTILVIVGPGNNGADGLVLARWLHFIDHKITILIHKTKHPQLLEICRNIGIPIVMEYPNHIYDLIIDAIFGFSGYLPLKEPYDLFVRSMAGHSNIVSIDVPSSYEVDGENNNPIFTPSLVVCLMGPKICCKNVKTYVTRAFVPKDVFYDKEYTNYITYTEL